MAGSPPKPPTTPTSIVVSGYSFISQVVGRRGCSFLIHLWRIECTHCWRATRKRERKREGARRRGAGCSCRILRHLCKYPAHVNDFSLACGIIMGAVGHGMLPQAPLTNEFSPTATVVVISYMILK